MTHALPLRRALPVVAAGGALGALARYALALALPVQPGAFPWATLLTNVTGCLALGLLLASRPEDLWARAFVGTGVLGGFTTFSTFALETDRLIARQCGGRAAGYVAASLAAGLLAAAAGLRWGAGRAA